MFDEETPDHEEFLEEDEESSAEAEAPEPAAPGPKSNTQQEIAFLRGLIERNTPVSVKIRGGEVYHGVIEYYDQRFIRLTREGQPNLFIFKKDILYLSET